MSGFTLRAGSVLPQDGTSTYLKCTGPLERLKENSQRLGCLIHTFLWGRVGWGRGTGTLKKKVVTITKQMSTAEILVSGKGQSCRLNPLSPVASQTARFPWVFWLSPTRTSTGLRTGVCCCPAYLWIHRWVCYLWSERLGASDRDPIERNLN